MITYLRVEGEGLKVKTEELPPNYQSPLIVEFLGIVYTRVGSAVIDNITTNIYIHLLPYKLWGNQWDIIQQVEVVEHPMYRMYLDEVNNPNEDLPY